MSTRLGALNTRLRTLGVVLAVIGLGFLVGGGVAFAKVQGGSGSLQAFSEKENVVLTYNADGQLVDRGKTEGAEAIMKVLAEDWKYPVVQSDLDPNDPLVNTATEYMYQMATIAYHVLNGTQTVVLEEPVEYKGETFKPGTYEFDVDGRYWTDFDREHPIEGPAREMAWSATAHALIAELGVGSVSASVLQLGLALAGLLAGIGVTLLLAGGGILWVSYGRVETGSGLAGAGVGAE
ncbi:MAG: hypothetical protein U0990_05005 [Candidatus Nanopelagicales bacterium]|nr:hypothetical protein [Candidatus Nanopelagicales bacterium]MDZ4249432.1 hypothetical protein [Candidatus Nanopelagicales bacterium]